MKIQDTEVLVSIIVPTYNHEKYIRKALESIFIQETSYSYEVVIGDDASTDGTQNILKEYQDKYPDKINLFLREENVGATKNSYGLLMAAKGKYLATLEGDDCWTDVNKLQKQVEFLENNPQFIGVCHKFDTVDSNGNPIKKKLGWVKHKEIFTLADFQGVYLPSQPSTFVRRNLYLDKDRDYEFLYKTNKMISDRTAILFYLSKGDFYCFNDAMSIYRVAADSSITKTLYGKNKYATAMDLELTEKLERLAQDEFNIFVDFTQHRKSLYTSAIIRFLISFNTENIALLKKIRNGRSRIVFAAHIPIDILTRILRKIYGVF